MIHSIRMKIDPSSQQMAVTVSFMNMCARAGMFNAQPRIHPTSSNSGKSGRNMEIPFVVLVPLVLKTLTLLCVIYEMKTSLTQ